MSMHRRASFPPLPGPLSSARARPQRQPSVLRLGRHALAVLGLGAALAAHAGDLAWPLPDGAGVRLLTPDALPGSKEVLQLHNASAWPVRVQLTSYDQAGRQLDSRSLLVTRSLSVSLADLSPQARSFAVVQEPGQGGELTLALPAQTSLRADTSAVRELQLSGAAAGAAPLTVYNPGSEPVQVTIGGASPQSVHLKPNEAQTVAAAPGAEGVPVSATGAVVVQSGAVGSSVLRFREPVSTVNVPAQCELAGTCAGKGVAWHSGRDYMAGTVNGVKSSATTDPVFAVNFGTLSENINFDQTLGSGSPSHNMGNTVILDHVLRTGERIHSLYAHMQSKSLVDTAIGARVAKGQRLGIIGCSGQTINEWCSGASNRHVHVEIRKKNYGDHNMWPFGYMDAGEAKELRQAGDPTPLPVDTAIRRIMQTVPDLQSAAAEVLLPYLSRSATQPGTASYDVYGLAGTPLYAAIALQPGATRTFTNVGVAGRTYAGGATANPFLCTSAKLSATSSPLTGTSSACVGGRPVTAFSADDYRFYAYSDLATGFGGGAELKFAVLPADSELVDNDGMLADTAGGQSTASRLGYYVADEANALDVPGYYLTAKLFSAGSGNFARWFPANARTYEVWVHVPRGATATAVTYKLYPRGRAADGSCSATHASNPCLVSNAIDQAANQDAWVRLRVGSQGSFAFTASATNGAYVGLAAATVTSGLVGADAVKFIAAVPPAAPAALVATATSSTQVGLSWTDKSADETGFRIERWVGKGPWTSVATVAANTTAYTDTGLSPSTAYSYQVRAVKDQLESANAGPASATTLPPPPAAPSNLTAAAAGSSKAQLGWKDNSSNETGFAIDRRTGTGNWVTVASVAAQSVSYTDSGLSPSTTYVYQVRALNGASSSAASGSASVTTAGALPAAPGNLTAPTVKATQVVLSWSDNSSNETGFKVERKLGLGKWSQIGTTGANAKSYTDGSVIGGRTYSYQVRATNAAGDSAFTPELKVSTPAR